MEMTPPDSSGGAELRPTLTVKVEALVVEAGLEVEGKEPGVRNTWSDSSALRALGGGLSHHIRFTYISCLSSTAQMRLNRSNEAQPLK